MLPIEAIVLESGGRACAGALKSEIGPLTMPCLIVTKIPGSICNNQVPSTAYDYNYALVGDSIALLRTLQPRAKAVPVVPLFAVGLSLLLLPLPFTSESEQTVPPRRRSRGRERPRRPGRPGRPRSRPT